MQKGGKIMEVYLDNSATTRPYEESVKYMSDIMLNEYGNPSSLHRRGIEAEKLIKRAKESIAATIKAKSSEIFFTSGGTESDNLAVMGVCGASRGKHIISTKIEHPAMLNTLEHLHSMGYKVDLLPVDKNGRVSLSALERLMRKDTVLVSIMHVNNEIGTIEPVEEIGRIIKQINKATLFHVDAVQSYCKAPFNVNTLKADLISLSSHKIHGPKGVGALYVRTGARLAPILFGGGQQNNLRPGTENVAGFAGFGMSAEICHRNMAESIERISTFKERLKNGIAANVSDIVINTPENSAPHILNISFGGIKSEVLLHSLESEEIYVSSGSACSSHKGGSSYVLTAIGVDKKLIDGSIRFSLSEFTTIEEIDKTIEAVIRNVEKIRLIMRK